MEEIKKRLDVILVERKLASSREKAKSMIASGGVLVNSLKALKPSLLYAENCKVEVLDENKLKFVSRGGLKLEKAINTFKISVNGLICMDIGASTGGFTDLLIKNCAKLVYAVDVGTGQLHESLKKSKKVINLEGVNIRSLDENLINHDIDFFTVDVSFISLKLVLPKIKSLIKNGAKGVCLIKPQFEAGKENVGKKGVVKDKKIHTKVLNEVCSFFLSCGFKILGLDYSPIKGPQGNIEYLIYLENSNESVLNFDFDIKNLVDLSHSNLK